MPDSYDFSGIATAYDVLCQDDRIIKKGAFDHQEGEVIPVVWRHGHDDIRNVLGHATLGVNGEPPGMRVKTNFNNTNEGRRAKKLVQDGDIQHLSIWANELDQVVNGSNHREVNKGTIREVSLVLAGKNPGAYIDDVVKHSEDPLNPDEVVEDGVIIHTEYGIELFAEEEEETEEIEETEEGLTHEDEAIGAVLKTLNQDQKRLFDVILHSAASGEKTPPSTPNAENGEGPTVEEVFNTLSEEQEKVLYYMAGEVSQENLSQGDTDPMPKETHNIFEESGGEEAGLTLSHESVRDVLATAMDTRAHSLRDVFAAHEIDDSVLSHSITDVDFMFPDAKKVDAGGPQYYSRPMEWVEQVLSACKTRPFSRIKSMYADLTGADARAKGYVTGNLKVEEVIAVLKRVTTPQTIYKLQKLDRDDIIDITDFDVVMWLKAEMRMMLREELARAILISDGRADTGDDAIISTNVRPIYNDNAVYTISNIYNDIGNEQDLADFTAAETVVLIDYIADARKDYRGSGSPVFYCQPEVLTKLLLVRDNDNLRIHRSVSELAEQLRVSRIVEVPPMSGMERTGVVDPTGLPAGTYDIATLGVIVNLSDYVIGADKGGQTAFFDDFDLDYNKYTYLYETRLSGALVNPYSAMAVELVTAKTA